MNNDKPSSESSHSPTEQPGDAKQAKEELKNLLTEVLGGINYVYRFELYNRIIAQFDLYEKAKAPALLSEVSTLRSKQAELIAEIERLKAKIAGLTTESGCSVKAKKS